MPRCCDLEADTYGEELHNADSPWMIHTQLLASHFLHRDLKTLCFVPIPSLKVHETELGQFERLYPVGLQERIYPGEWPDRFAYSLILFDSVSDI